MPEELHAVLSLAQSEHLHAEYSWKDGCVYVYMQFDPDEEAEAVPVYNYGGMLDLLGN